VAQVEVDRETGAVRVVRSVALPDVGSVLDGAMARGSVEGGVVMGLGAALSEEMLWGPEGRLLNPGLLDYRLPTLGDVPPIELDIVEGFAGSGPSGMKGLGEPPIIPVAAAVANAVADATGARVTELPLTAERVARALKLL
jgi:CO/xanthine dehydrogenase Mo-binding subunit